MAVFPEVVAHALPFSLSFDLDSLTYYIEEPNLCWNSESAVSTLLVISVQDFLNSSKAV